MRTALVTVYQNRYWRTWADHAHCTYNKQNCYSGTWADRAQGICNKQNCHWGTWADHAHCTCICNRLSKLLLRNINRSCHHFFSRLPFWKRFYMLKWTKDKIQLTLKSNSLSSSYQHSSVYTLWCKSMSQKWRMPLLVPSAAVTCVDKYYFIV